MSKNIKNTCFYSRNFIKKHVSSYSILSIFKYGSMFRSHPHEAAELAAMNPLGRVMKRRDVNAWLPCRVHDSLNCDQCQVLRFDCARFIHEFGRYAGEKCIDPEPLWVMKSGFCSCVAACFARLCCCIPECTDIYNSVQQSHYCLTRE